MKNTLATSVRFGAFELDLTSGELCGESRRVHLAEKPFRILGILLEYDGKLVTREDIQKRLWPNDTAVDFEHGINTAIKTLRRTLGDSAEKPMYIETIPRRGYRLMTPVQSIAPADSPKQANAQLTDTPSTAALTARGVLTGRTVSHYRVLEVIGGGGMGVVYRAEDLKLGRAVALKFLPEDLGSDPSVLERFSREARAASSLDHSNICAIHEFGEHEGHPFIVMQLLEGQTLRDRMAAIPGPLPLEELLDVGIQVSHGLQAAHERGILHRDIKPANIFLTRKGVCKVLDFGLAKLLEADEKDESAGAPIPSSVSSSPISAGLTVSRTGSTMGTAGYMSPEQVLGEKLDARSDLFSFGLVLYEMATGQRAFGGESAVVVQDAILHHAPVPVQELNPTLPLQLISTINKALEKNRGQRCGSAADILAKLEMLQDQAPEREWARRRHKLLRWGIAGLVVLALIVGGLYWRSKRPPILTEKNSIIIADFANLTGETIFDDTLRQALALHLGQSPYIGILPDRQMRTALQQMEKSREVFVTAEIAQEICLRTRSNAVLAGSIAPAGNSYDLVLKALSCQTGHTLAITQKEAANRNQVLQAVGEAADQMRIKLGESLASVEKFDQPLIQATTSSLEALQALSKAIQLGTPTESIPHIQRALELDPSFALAYAKLGAAYWNVGEADLAAQNITKAYQLRNRVSQRERFYIETTYYSLVTRELEKGERSAKEWAQNYPGDWDPHNSLSIIYSELGKSYDAVREIQEVIRLSPDNPGAYGNEVGMLSATNQLAEAQAVYQKARARNLDSPYLRQFKYNLAFLQGDEAGMREQLQWAAGKPRTEDVLLSAQSNTEAYYGRLRQAREFSRRAVDSARRADAMESAAGWRVSEALREAELGNSALARQAAQQALSLNAGRDTRISSALALARAGDIVQAKTLSEGLNTEFPLDTILQYQAVPCIQAAIELQLNKPLQALELLEPSRPYELSQESISYLYPAYLRGEAYLQSNQPQRAAAEFQRLIDNPGIIGNFVTGALVHLQLGRVQAMHGDKVAAVHSYSEFLQLWKDADPDVPIYRQAKAEYRKLQ